MSNKTIVCVGKGSVKETLSFKDLPVPELKENDLLVRVKACALNPIDVKARQGMTGEAERVLGYDGAGVVEKVGSGVGSAFSVGDEVMFAGDITRPGSNAELIAIDHRITSRKPKKASWAEAASLPLVTITAYEALFERLSLQEGSENLNVLVINGAGGVGSIAIQLAKQILGAKTVIATASRDETVAFCKKMGATHVINHRNSLKEELEKAGVTNGVDVVICAVDLEKHFNGIAEIINPLGKIASITLGGEAASIDVSKLFFPKAVTLAFELMFTRPMFNREPERQGKLLQRVADLFDEGKIVSCLTKTVNGFTIEALEEAHDNQESGSAIGKCAVVY